MGQAHHQLSVLYYQFEAQVKPSILKLNMEDDLYRNLDLHGKFIVIPEELTEGLKVGPVTKDKLGPLATHASENQAAILIEGIIWRGIPVAILDFRVNEHLPNEDNPYVLIGQREGRLSDLDNIVKDKKSGIHNREFTLDILMLQFLNDKAIEKIMDIISKDPEKGMLFIIGHGGHSNLGVSEMSGGGIKVDALLDNLDRVLGESAREKYSIIAINTCNPEGLRINQEVVDKLGIPVVYPNNISGVEIRQSGTTSAIFAYPTTAEINT